LTILGAHPAYSALPDADDLIRAFLGGVVPRLFTGLEVPADVASALSSLRGGISGARWVAPSDYHITLRFVGDVDNPTASEFAETLDGIAAPSFTVTLQTLDAFGGRDPHAIVARVKSTPELEALQDDHERTARAVGLPPERRKFSPHVTLARLRSASPESVAGWLGCRAIGRAISFRAERFVLFSARESVGGGPYMVEADYPLR
jgi:2'-5' RNA ligase